MNDVIKISEKEVVYYHHVMFKLKRLFSFLIFFCIFIFLVLFGLVICLLASGARVKYDVSQRRFELDVSKDKFVESLLSRYFINLPLTGRVTNKEVVQEKKWANPFGEINKEIAKSKSGLDVYPTALIPGIIGRQYKNVVQVGAYDLNAPISGQVVSEMPPGLQLSPCQTEYNSPAIEKIAVNNSFARCYIEGIPQQSGEFTLKVRFYVEGRDGYFEESIPIVVFPDDDLNHSNL